LPPPRSSDWAGRAVGSTVLRAPTAGELTDVASLAVRAAVFESVDELRDLASVDPWRVLVTDAGDAVVVERWREHLDWLAMRAVWAAPRRMPGLVEGVREVARKLGLRTVLSPFVASELAGPYEDSGMSPRLRVLMLRRAVTAEDLAPPPVSGWSLAEAGPDDAGALVELDRASFDPVWAYDRTILDRFLVRDRVVVASRGPGGPPLGYIVASLSSEEGMIGRLAVDPVARGSGVGSALVAEALRGIGLAGGAYATLTTQSDNVAAQRLYSRFGFKTLRGELVGLTVGV
jgi:ribosomal-protein-alanine N-acetyltransferase